MECRAQVAQKRVKWKYLGVMASLPQKVTSKAAIRGTLTGGYHARGVPFGPDDGTTSAGAAVASLPFAPEIVLPTIEYFLKTEVGKRDPCGFAASFDPMFGDSTPQNFWQSKYNFGLNHGLLILMIENFRSGLIWRLMRNCQPIVNGLQRAGFSGAWLPSGKVFH